jgi:hypothetical protein
MKKQEDAFDRIAKRVKPSNEIFVDFGLDFAKQMKYSMSIHATIKSQKDLALALGKEESEISRWMTGLHNLTLDSMSKVMGVLGRDMIMTDLRAREKYLNALPVSANFLETTTAHTSVIYKQIIIDGANQYYEINELTFQMPKIHQIEDQVKIKFEFRNER